MWIEMLQMMGIAQTSQSCGNRGIFASLIFHRAALSGSISRDGTQFLAVESSRLERLVRPACVSGDRDISGLSSRPRSRKARDLISFERYGWSNHEIPDQ
jgi:hypothetical protein